MEIVLTGAWVLGILVLVTMAGLPVLQALAETARRGEQPDPPAVLDVHPGLDGGPTLPGIPALARVPAQRTASEAPEHVAC